MNIDQINDLLIAGIFQHYSDTAKELGAINLAQGMTEPIMDKHINQVFTHVVNKGWQYTDPRGLESLRVALCNEYDNEYTLDKILITSGCTESLYLGVFAAGKCYGSKVAFLEPFYPYYTSLGRLLNIESVPITMVVKESRMLPDWDKIESAFQSGIKIFLLNTPHNPSGWVMTTTDAQILRKLADKYGVFLIVDEAYRYYTYTQSDANAAVRILYDNNLHILLLGSASKLLSATGLRIGWMLGQKKVIDIAYAVHLYTTYCHPAPLQELVATILDNRDKTWFISTIQHYIAKRDKLLKAIKAVGFECESVSGGHFLLADYSHLQKQMNCHEFANYFAKEYGIMALPADIFYQKTSLPKQLRFSFSGTMERLDQAILRMNP
jgi:N-succinyldiaminopimelate aminotransferase